MKIKVVWEKVVNSKKQLISKLGLDIKMQKIINIGKKIVKEFLILLLLFILSTILVIIGNYDSKYFPFLDLLLSFILGLYIIWKGFQLYFWLINTYKKYDMKKKAKVEGKYNLYEWTSNSNFDYYFIYEILNYESNKNTIEKLKEIKEKIEKGIGKPLQNYELLKLYLENHSKHNLMDKFTTIIIGAILATITATIISFTTNESLVKKYIKQMLNAEDSIGTFNIIFNGILFFFLCFTTLLILVNFSLKEKRQIDLLISFVDLIIHEKKEKKNLYHLRTNK